MALAMPAVYWSAAGSEFARLPKGTKGTISAAHHVAPTPRIGIRARNINGDE
ncbi:hypothetical protein J2S70_000987 [Trueperella bonasi]|uniref:Uncharacterized protein n=1 Tax=Trueperella bonasi TaxID=312286 RepID=A0ABT9NG77_9ACTO|nr:hypothetical protein [Trueperella bonasi]